MSARQFCKEGGYSVARLYWWSSQLKREISTKPVKATIPIVRVVRRSTSSTRSRGAPIVIQVGHARVEVGADADGDALTLVLQTLARSSLGGQS
jgi:hypothetical protein